MCCMWCIIVSFNLSYQFLCNKCARCIQVTGCTEYYIHSLYCPFQVPVSYLQLCQHWQKPPLWLLLFYFFSACSCYNSRFSHAFCYIYNLSHPSLKLQLQKSLSCSRFLPCSLLYQQSLSCPRYLTSPLVFQCLLATQ